MHITYIYSDIIQNKGYAPGLALGRRGVNKVSNWSLLGSLLYENLLLVLFNYLLVLLLAHRHELYQLVIYMHEMVMHHLVIQQQQLLKYEYIYQTTKLALPTKTLSCLSFPLNRYETFDVLT